MGYITYFSLSKIEGSEQDYTAFVERLLDLTGMDFRSEADEGKWYDWETDMRSLSQEYPNLLVELCGNGEENDDTWQARFKGGDMEFVETVMPPFKRLVEKNKADKIAKTAKKLSYSLALDNIARSVLKNIGLPEAHCYSLSRAMASAAVDYIAKFK